MTNSESPVSYSLEEYPELLPYDQENYSKEALEIEIDDGNSKRVMVIERNNLPLFTYPLERRLSTMQLRSVWLEHAKGILSDRGLTLEG